MTRPLLQGVMLLALLTAPLSEASARCELPRHAERINSLVGEWWTVVKPEVLRTAGVRHLPKVREALAASDALLSLIDAIRKADTSKDCAAYVQRLLLTVLEHDARAREWAFTGEALAEAQRVDKALANHARSLNRLEAEANTLARALNFQPSRRTR